MTQLTAKPRPRFRRLRWILKAILVSPLLYGLLALVGLFPANAGFRPADQGVDIYVVSNGVHTDLVLPTQTEAMDWRTLFPARYFAAQRNLSHIRFGWGDRQFYLETPTWSDVRVPTVLRSMFLPTSCTLHVENVGRPLPGQRCRRLRLDNSQYRALVAQIRGTLTVDSGGDALLIAEPGYARDDAFFEARGTYHLFNTCNCWTGRVLRKSGVRVGIWTPFPASVMRTLPSEDAWDPTDSERSPGDT